MAMSLAGKTAIVTGAGSGINLSFARLLLSKKCNVLFADLALRPEAQELVSNHSSPVAPAKAVFQKTDVRDWSQLEKMFKVARKQFGDEGVDIVCPGAGVYEPPWSSFWNPPPNPPSRDDPSTSRYALLDINLTHPIRTTQLALSHFLSHRPKPGPHEPRPRKHIVHISSIAGQTTPLLAPLYNASKHALSGFVRTLAPLDTLGIRVTAVAPGVIRTPLWTDNPEKLRLVSAEDAWVTPEFVAAAMADLVSKEEIEVPAAAAAATSGGGGGESIPVRGGLVLEVAKGSVREVKQFGDEGPRGAGNTVGGMGLAEEEILRGLEGGGWGGGEGGGV